MLAKIIKLALLAVAALVVVGFIALQIIMGCGKPNYNGRIMVTSENLGAETAVYRDDFGVAHIVADTERDAFFALGYAHAQDRIFQMFLTRLACQGRLTEVVGDAPTDPGMLGHESLLEQDKFNRVVGFADLGRRGVAYLDPQSLELAEAYAAGVNLYLERTKKLPPEFLLLGVKPEPWTVADSLTIGRLIAWGLSHNMTRELTRIKAVSELGVERGWELVDRYPDYGPYIIDPSVKQYDPRGKTFEKRPMPIDPGFLNARVVTALLDIKHRTAFGPGIKGFDDASNNWVVSGALSKSGKPILSNDPHLLNMLPSIFYQTRILTKDGVDAIGVTFPGMPFMALGHNRHVAWAATTTRADVQDLFVEQTNPDKPNEYLHMDEWKQFETREEAFKIKEGKKFREEKIIVRKTVHGTVLNDIIKGAGKDAAPIALAWTGYFKSDDIKGFLGLSRAGSADELKASLALIGSPVQNWMYADDTGNIGYFASGLYPIRKKGDGTMPVPGWTGEYDWNGFVPIADLPQLDNPSNNVIISANNAVLPEKDYPFVVSDNYQYYRGLRLKELLSSKDVFTTEDMHKFQMDVYSKQAERLAPVFISAFEAAGDSSDSLASAAVEVLRKWDFECKPENAGPTVFFWAYRIALDLVFKDELSESLHTEFLRSQALDTYIDDSFESGASSFFDNINTLEKETRDDILAEALKIAATKLAKRFGPKPDKWTWGKSHIVYFNHPFSSVPGMKLFFPSHEQGAYGGRETVFNAFHFWDKDIRNDVFNVAAGPAYRMVIDMADIEGAGMIIDTGQGGHSRSRHLFNQNHKWTHGGLIPMNMDIKAVSAMKKGKLTFEPSKPEK